MAISDQENAAITDWLGGNLRETSEEEREARRAMARVLREEPLAMGIRGVLADMFDPDMRDTVKQQFVLKRARVRGRPKVNDRRVAAVVWHRIKAGDQKKAAYQHAVDELGVGCNTAEKAFARWEKHFSALADWAPESSFFKKMTRTTDP